MTLPRRVVITGMGVVSPVGADLDTFWSNCMAGKAVATTIPETWKEYTTFKSNIWAPLPPLDFGPLRLTLAERTQRDPSALLGLLAATAAIEDAELVCEQISIKDNTFSLRKVVPERAAVFIGSGVGGINTISNLHAHHLLARPKAALNDVRSRCKHDIGAELHSINESMRIPSRFNPFAVSMVMPNAVSAVVGIKFSLTGPNQTLCEACAAGTAAIGQAFQAIRHGNVDLAISGGVEYVSDEYGSVFHAFDAGGVLVRNCDDPQNANRPFDTERSGMLLAEGGAGIMILEDLSHAERRGARIYAEISGYGETFDAHNIMIVEPNGRAIMRAQKQALSTAGLAPADIDYVNAHGTGTRVNDEIEARIILEVFGSDILVNSTKSILGHSLGASGGIEAIVCALSLRDQATHACHNLEAPLEKLNFVRESVPQRLRSVISQSFAFGGHNAVLILRKWQG